MVNLSDNRWLKRAFAWTGGRRTRTNYRTLHLLEERDRARTSRNPHLEKMLQGQANNPWRWIVRNGLTTPWRREIGMKYADCVKDTARNLGGSKTLTGMLLNQINGLKLWRATSSQCSGHHVQLHSTCDVPLLVSTTSISEAGVVESVKSLKRRKAAGSDGIPP